LGTEATEPPIVPGDEAELASAIAEAAAAGRGVATEGSGTKTHYGPRVSPGAKRVSLRAFNRVVAYEPGDMVVSVEAGVKLRDLQETLGRHGQWLPLDPPFRDATVGGVIATNGSGPRRLAYGTVKDVLLGARVVGSTGGITKSGGRVVKNVSGYDLHKLHVGAFGTLGIVVEASFRVLTKPEGTALLWLSGASLEACHEVLLAIAATSLRPTLLEALDASSARALGLESSGWREGQALALVGVEGSAPLLRRHKHDLEAFRGRLGERHGSAWLEGAAVDRVLEALRDLPEARDAVTLRIASRPHDLSALLEALELPARAQAVVLRAAVGIARVAVPASSDLADLAALLRRWQETARAHGGYAAVESAPLDRVNRDRLPWGATGDTSLGELLKRRWDPGTILNPGRMPC
jgi:glycolate oxidase FAD binding subunit